MNKQKMTLGNWLALVVSTSIVLGFFGLALWGLGEVIWGLIEAMMTRKFWNGLIMRIIPTERELWAFLLGAAVGSDNYVLERHPRKAGHC